MADVSACLPAGNTLYNATLANCPPVGTDSKCVCDQLQNQVANLTSVCKGRDNLSVSAANLGICCQLTPSACASVWDQFSTMVKNYTAPGSGGSGSQSTTAAPPVYTYPSVQQSSTIQFTISSAIVLLLTAMAI